MAPLTKPNYLANFSLTIPSFYAPQYQGAFLAKPILAEVWNAITDAIYWSPTSQGYEPYRVLVIDKLTNELLLKTLASIATNQANVATADKLVIFISLPRKIFASNAWIKQRAMRQVAAHNAHLSSTEIEALVKAKVQQAKELLFTVAHPNGDAWAMKQTHIGLAFALSAAALLGVNYVRLDALSRHAAEAFLLTRELLNDGERVANIIAFGYAPMTRLNFKAARAEALIKVVEI